MPGRVERDEIFDENSFFFQWKNSKTWTEFFGLKIEIFVKKKRNFLWKLFFNKKNFGIFGPKILSKNKIFDENCRKLEPYILDRKSKTLSIKNILHENCLIQKSPKFWPNFVDRKLKLCSEIEILMKIGYFLHRIF